MWKNQQQTIVDMIEALVAQTSPRSKSGRAAKAEEERAGYVALQDATPHPTPHPIVGIDPAFIKIFGAGIALIYLPPDFS